MRVPLQILSVAALAASTQACKTDLSGVDSRDSMTAEIDGLPWNGASVSASVVPNSGSVLSSLHILGYDSSSQDGPSIRLEVYFTSLATIPLQNSCTGNNLSFAEVRS